MDQKELTPWLRLSDVISLKMVGTLCQQQQLSSDRVDAELLFLTIISQQVRLPFFFIALFIIKHYQNIDKTQNKRRKKPPKILPSYKPNCLFFFMLPFSPCPYADGIFTVAITAQIQFGSQVCLHPNVQCTFPSFPHHPHFYY